MADSDENVTQQQKFFQEGMFSSENAVGIKKDNPEVFINEEARKQYFDLMLLNNNTPGYTAPTLNSFRGFNPFNSGPAMMQISDAVIGLMFITRPHLNLADSNIYRSEKLISLAEANTNDLSGYVRGLLDPTWATKTFGADGHPMLDNNMPFISCLNEYLKTSTGFSDLQLKINTTEPGIRQQVYQHVNGKLEENGKFTIQQTYHSPKPMLIQTMFQHWLGYISEVKSGDNQFTPHPQFLIGHRCDHDCRIYHLLMNVDTEYLESLFATVQSIPENYPAGAIADIDRTQNTLRAQGQDEFSMQFSSVGMRFDELSLIKSFNEHVYLFNPDLQSDVESGNPQRWRMLKISEYSAYRYMMYPLLLVTQRDVRTSGVKQKIRQGVKLTWWVRRNSNG